MELLFYYSKDQKYIDPKGIQFGGKYVFDFQVDSNKIYFQENTNYKPNFYSDRSSLQNLTAVVGENGSGKTTVLRAIFENSVSGVLMVFLEHNNSIILSNNYGNVSIEYIGRGKAPEIIEDERYLLRQEPNKQHIIRNIHRTISYVYMTNSIYPQYEWAYSKDVSISKVMLTPTSLHEVSQQFYRNINSLRFDDRKFHEDDDYVNIIHYKESSGFPLLCTMEYYYFLLTNNLKEKYIGKVLQDIQVRAVLPFINTQVLIDNDADENRFNQIWDSYYEVCTTVEKRDSGITNVLLCELMLEICNLLELACNPDIEMANIERLTKECSNLLEILEKKENPQLKSAKKYYQFAFESIKRLHSILGDSLKYANDNGVIISWKNEEKYRAFIQLVHECLFEEEYLGTFLITHLIFEQNGLSSGEQAMQNFFSWIHALDWFHRIDQNTIDGLKDNIILLIDEIDLYAHPEWQRQIICRLLENINNQFRRKKVQVIFSTHSPLVLSDMLLNNTIYLQEGKRITPPGMRETFSNELYSILNHSFFLKNGVIGEFARQKIQKIIDLLVDLGEKKRLEKVELQMIEEEIKLVGDPILKIKLYEMFDDYRLKDEETETDIDSEIRMLEKRIQYLEEQKK